MTKIPHSNDNPPNWYTAFKSPEWWLVIAAFATIIVIGLQTIETRRAAQATRDSVGAIQQQGQTFVSKERARVRVHLRPLILVRKHDIAYVVEFTVINVGPTPAFIMDSGHAGYLRPKQGLDIQGTEPTTLPISELPKEMLHNAPTGAYAIYMGNKAENEVIADIKAERLIVWVDGFVKYRDVFGQNQETRFRCFWQFPPWRGIYGEDIAGAGNWVPYPPEENYET